MSGAKKKILGKLQDETPPTAGQEISAALTQSNEKISRLFATAISEAIKQRNASPTVIDRWVFEVERDQNNLMTRIVAKAERV
jgi:hypothetical protein